MHCSRFNKSGASVINQFSLSGRIFLILRWTILFNNDNTIKKFNYENVIIDLCLEKGCFRCAAALSKRLARPVCQTSSVARRVVFAATVLRLRTATVTLRRGPLPRGYRGLFASVPFSLAHRMDFFYLYHQQKLGYQIIVPKNQMGITHNSF